ncbi:MAG: lipocalin family protein [Rhodospirillales bacterium]|nr:lipocalin family protein [Rhodospirillales bacterium]
MRRIAVLLFAGLMLAGCTTFGTHQPLARHVDLTRYAGRWYIIANIPYFAERGNVASFFDVSFPHGAVRDVYHGRSGGFGAKPSRFVMNGYVVKGTEGAYWRESPLWPLYFSYLILYVDPGYQTALVGYPGRGYGWVLSRHRRMDDGEYHALLARFAALGYDTSKFRRIPQFPDQVGKPGFIHVPKR